MDKNKFLFIIEDKNDFYNNIMQDMAKAYTKNTEYTGYLKYHLTDDMVELNAFLLQARERGIRDVIMDTTILPERFYSVIAHAIRNGLDVKDITTGLSVKNSLLDSSIQRSHKEIGSESNKAIGVIWNNESDNLVNWYKEYCNKNGLEYAGTKHLTTDDTVEIFQFISDTKFQEIGKVLVAGPFFMLVNDKVNPLMDMLKENDIEVLDALFNTSLTDYCCFRDIKNTALIMLGDDTDLIENMNQYAHENNYEITFGCGLIGDTLPKILVEIIPQIATKENVSTIIIPSKEHFKLNQFQWDELINNLNAQGIEIDSMEEGLLEQNMQATHLMN